MPPAPQQEKECSPRPARRSLDEGGSGRAHQRRDWKRNPSEVPTKSWTEAVVGWRLAKAQLGRHPAQTIGSGRRPSGSPQLPISEVRHVGKKVRFVAIGQKHGYNGYITCF